MKTEEKLMQQIIEDLKARYFDTGFASADYQIEPFAMQEIAIKENGTTQCYKIIVVATDEYNENKGN